MFVFWINMILLARFPLNIIVFLQNNANESSGTFVDDTL